jgi:hypothetical protein
MMLNVWINTSEMLDVEGIHGNNIGKLLYHPGGGGKRILYGYMASKADLDIFNWHHKGGIKRNGCGQH